MRQAHASAFKFGVSLHFKPICHFGQDNFLSSHPCRNLAFRVHMPFVFTASVFQHIKLGFVRKLIHQNKTQNLEGLSHKKIFLFVLHPQVLKITQETNTLNKQKKMIWDYFKKKVLKSTKNYSTYIHVMYCVNPTVDYQSQTSQSPGKRLLHAPRCRPEWYKS